MLKKLPLLLLLPLLPPAPACAVQTDEGARVVVNGVRDAEWGSYRYAYGAAAFFAKYTATRPLIQAHMQVRPLAPDAPLAGLLLQLSGEHTDIALHVDAIGRVAVPLLKAAYDEDAVLRLNRPHGSYYFSGRYSIKERDDGRYRAADLRAACAQLIDAQRSSGYRLRLIGKRCTGVKLVYAIDDDAASASFAGADASRPLPVAIDHPFEDNSMGMYKTIVYRFADWPADGIISAPLRPLAIGTIYE